jgi:predicted RNase H-like HicB family nuclease
VKAPHYNINVYWSDEDACWIADVPDLRPCSAHGDTAEEAVAHVRDAIEGWLAVARDRGFPIPKPRYRPAIYAARDAA